jgi:hypothetical protein
MDAGSSDDSYSSDEDVNSVRKQSGWRDGRPVAILDTIPTAEERLEFCISALDRLSKKITGKQGFSNDEVKQEFEWAKQEVRTIL